MNKSYSIIVLGVSVIFVGSILAAQSGISCGLFMAVVGAVFAYLSWILAQSFQLAQTAAAVMLFLFLALIWVSIGGMPALALTVVTVGALTVGIDLGLKRNKEHVPTGLGC